MLILADTDRLRIDFYQFGKGILDAARHGGGTSLFYVKIRKFLRPESACGVDRSSGLIGDDVLHLLRNFLQQINDHLL